MYKKILLIAVVVYAISAGLSYAVFTKIGLPMSRTVVEENLPEETALGALLNIDPNEPRDQACPLNGKLYTNTERQAWEKRRPLAVMIENDVNARPQAGLGSADVVYEAIAEGGITRFMAMFYCGAQRYDTTLAPIRSARTYFIDWASGYNFPLYVHVGGANIPGPTDALGQINTYGWAMQNDINQFSVGYPTFVRNANRLGRPVATEHTMETTTEKLWAVGEDRGWTNMSPNRRIAGQAVPGMDWKDGFTPWTFQDGNPGAGNTAKISYNFWSGYNDFSVAWEYDQATNTYKRTMGSEPHVDQNSNEQIAASNVVVLLTDERGPINEAKHMLYRTTGTGNALIFQNGQAIQARWSKPTRTDELTFVDNRGNPVQMVRGLTWISVIDSGNQVTY